LPLDFVAFAKDPACRDQARRILIARYFQPSERAALYDLVGLPIPSADQIARDAAYKSPDEVARQGREPIRIRDRTLGFCVVSGVLSPYPKVAAYHYTCALTRYRLTAIAGGSIVDAAHIHQFSDSRNNDPWS